MVNEIYKDLILDADIVEEDELNSTGLSGTPFHSSVSVTSITASTKRVVFDTSVDLLDPRVQEDDILVILSGPAAGTYAVDEIDPDNDYSRNILTVKETIVDSGATTANIFYRSGAKITGFDPTSTPTISSLNVQDAIAQANNNSKSGTVLPGSFTGSPVKKYTVVLGVPFDDDLYSVTVTGSDERIFTIESKTATGFTISTNANQSLTGNVFWQAIRNSQ